MMGILLKLGLLCSMLLALPMLGIFLAGYPVSRYLEFPPVSRYVDHAPFSWVVFAACAVFITVVVTPFVLQWFRAGRAEKNSTSSVHPFPWWGWTGAAVGAVSWILAWTWFPWFSMLQPHTFTPLWLSYIVVVNALTFRRTGRCMIIDRTGFFLMLFPVGAVFWWFFEYLNRFVQNWSYTGADYGPMTYFMLATLSFSTVLPAVSSTREWIQTSNRLDRAFTGTMSLRFGRPKAVALAVLFVSGAGLAVIGLAPDILFPLLWVSPLLIAVSLKVLMKDDHVLGGIAAGNWHPAVTAALSALVCGFFWEMWNFHSLARWDYAVPFVHRFQLFEMPLLGYAGYLPFGLECAVVVDTLDW